jgi:hypothetical protein
VSNRQNKKVEEEEKLLKLFQGVNSGVNRCFMPLIRQITWMVRIGEGIPACGMTEQDSQRSWQIGTVGQNSHDEM